VVQLIRRYWYLSRDRRRRRRRVVGGLGVELTASRSQADSFLEKHGMARDRRPTSELINVVQQNQNRSVVTTVNVADTFIFYFAFYIFCFVSCRAWTTECRFDNDAS